MGDADVTITLRANDEASKTFRNSFTELSSKIGIAKQAAEALAAALRQLYEIGKTGAVAAQTAQSFERLTKSLGVAPTLLNDLRRASNGTIDDLSLMSSTMTLAAGAGDDMAKKMLEVAPQILEIAKAASALNPKLGDTTFLYNSLMTGIKRGSPLLIDNTGLTLRIGEANEAYADALGKTVEQLTDAERKQALINATLEAGANLIRQVGGSTESATDVFERYTATMQNLKDELAMQFLPTISNVFVALDTLIGWGRRVDEAYESNRQTIANTATSWDEYSKSIQASLEQQGFFTKEVDGVIEVFKREGQVTHEVTGKFELMNEQVWISEDAMKKSKLAAKLYADEHDRNLRPALEETTEAQEDLTVATQDWVDEINTNLTGALEDAMEAIDTFVLGGWELQLAYEEVMKQLREDKITPDEAREKFEEIYVQAAIIEGLTAGLTFEEIAQNISTALGIPLGDALDKAGELYSYLQLIDGSTVGINIQWNNANAPLPGSKYVPPGGAGGGGGAGSGNKIAYQAGGPVWGGRPILVGEAGPELFTPTANGYITNNTTTFNMSVNTQAQQSSVIADYNLMRAMAGA